MVSHRFLLRKRPLEKTREGCREVNSTLRVIFFFFLVCLVCMLFLLLSLYVCFSACSGCMNFFLREIFHVWIFFLSSPFSFPMVHPLKLNGPWKVYRVFSLTWPESMLIYWNKRKRLHNKRVQLPEDWFGTPTWPPFHCFGTPIWPP